MYSEICLMERRLISSSPVHRASSQQTSHQSQAIKPKQNEHLDIVQDNIEMQP